MTNEELLAKLLQGGCFIDALRYGTYPVGYAALVPGALAWCTMWPEGNQDAHLTEYNSAGQVYGRDLMLMQDGVMVAYLCPWAETEKLPDNYHDSLRAWQQGLLEDDLRVWLLLDNFQLTP